MRWIESTHMSFALVIISKAQPREYFKDFDITWVSRGVGITYRALSVWHHSEVGKKMYQHRF